MRCNETTNRCCFLFFRVKGLAVSPDCMFLFSASTDGSIRAWKLLQPLVNVHPIIIIVFLVHALIQEESVCVGVYETGSRLNCITLTTLKQTAESGKTGLTRIDFTHPKQC